jgi:Bromodomain
VLVPSHLKLPIGSTHDLLPAEMSPSDPRTPPSATTNGVTHASSGQVPAGPQAVATPHLPLPPPPPPLPPQINATVPVATLTVSDDAGRPSKPTDTPRQAVTTRDDLPHSQDKRDVKHDAAKEDKAGARADEARRAAGSGPRVAYGPRSRERRALGVFGTGLDITATGTSGTGRTRGRRASGAHEAEMAVKDGNVYMMRCYMEWKKLYEEKLSMPFRMPVSARDAPGYYDIVKRPMDLQSVRQQLADGTVSTPAEFLTTMLQISKNAMKYNPRESDVHELAEEFEQRVRQVVGPIIEWWRQETEGKKSGDGADVCGAENVGGAKKDGLALKPSAGVPFRGSSDTGSASRKRRERSPPDLAGSDEDEQWLGADDESDDAELEQNEEDRNGDAGTDESGREGEGAASAKGGRYAARRSIGRAGRNATGPVRKRAVSLGSASGRGKRADWSPRTGAETDDADGWEDGDEGEEEEPGKVSRPSKRTGPAARKKRAGASGVPVAATGRRGGRRTSTPSAPAEAGKPKRTSRLQSGKMKRG